MLRREGGVGLWDPVRPGPLPRLGGARARDNSWAGLLERSSDWLLHLTVHAPLSSTRPHRS